MDYSKIPSVALKGINKKDQALITDNPGATLAELATKGLSQKAETKLMEIEASVVKVEAKKLIPKKVTLGAPKSKATPTATDRVKFRNFSTGLTVEMRRRSAQYLVNNKQGQIV